MLVTELLDWLTINLHSEFGDDYQYYVEEIEQDVSKPCFSVITLEPAVISRGTFKYRKVVPLVIHYFTDCDNTSGAMRDCQSVGERLWNKLEYLSCGDVLLRGEGLSWGMTDGVLQFFVTYTFDIMRTEDKTLMDDGLSSEVQIKNLERMI